MSAILDNEQLGEILLGHQRFRLETLADYSVGDDGVDYERFIAGAPEPTWERKRPWMTSCAPTAPLAAAPLGYASFPSS
jgi:hypothetical protein